MPSRPYFAGELRESSMLLELAAVLESGDESDQELAEDLFLMAAEPMQRRNIQAIGPARLSIERLQREADERGFTDDDLSSNSYRDFGYRLAWLPDVVAALQVPETIRTWRHTFTGEEAVLILLRRFRTTGTLLDLTWETGRSTSALSECIRWMVCASYLRMRRVTV